VKRITSRAEERDKPTNRPVRIAQYDAIVEWGIPDSTKLARLASIRQRTLVARGDNDTMISTINSHILGQHLPNVRIRIYSDADHGFLFQWPTEFADLDQVPGVMPVNRITMYGTTWCQDCKRAKKFLGEHHVPYDFVDADQDENGLRVVEQTGGALCQSAARARDGELNAPDQTINSVRVVGGHGAPVVTCGRPRSEAYLSGEHFEVLGAVDSASVVLILRCVSVERVGSRVRIEQHSVP
jgi:glutaredoxin